MTITENAVRYQLAPDAQWLTLGDAIIVWGGGDVLQLEGDSAVAVRQALDALSGPRTKDELGDDADELLGFLLGAGVVREVAPTLLVRDGAVAQALRAGCAVLCGEGMAGDIAKRVAELLHARAVATLGPRALTRMSALSDVQAQLWIGCFSSPIDPVNDLVNEAARAAGRLYLPVFLDGKRAIVGPMVRPPGTPGDRAQGPCARCAVMRLIARVPSNLHELWQRAQDNGAELHAGQVENAGRARAIAEQVTGFLTALDEAGAIGGVIDPLVRFDLETRLADAHRVVRNGSCRTCGPPLPARGHVPDLAAGAARTMQRWQQILAHDPELVRPPEGLWEAYKDPVTGMLNYGEEWTHRAGYFRNLPECWGGISFVREAEYMSTGMMGVNGTGATLEEMRLVSFSEGMERYAQYSHRPAVVDVPYRDVAAYAYDPRKIALHDEEQYATPGFPRPRFREEDPLRWTWGYGLVRGQAKLFPQELITINLTDVVYPHRIFTQNLSTGGSSHASYTKALLNSLREHVERDALMIAWYKRIPLPHVEMPEKVGDPYCDDLLSFLRGAGVELTVLDMRLDFPIPTFLILGRLKETVGCFYAGGTVGCATADLDPLAALGRGLGEMRIHYETLALTPHPQKEWTQFPYNPTDPTMGWRGWWPNYMAYLNPALLPCFRFLDESPYRLRFSDIKGFEQGSPVQSRDMLIAMYDKCGLEPYVWDLVEDPVVKESGFRVLKVEVPGMVPLVPGRQSRRLHVPRLEAVARLVGRPCLPVGEINPDSHLEA
ncbi:MAG: TOMM precursor leader peptide-binding protein [Deltaproteobacteria bacterium]|nr:TOMM precursor leader peptide-binding protein [Deltaproteobacteria bacterium]